MRVKLASLLFSMTQEHVAKMNTDGEIAKSDGGTNSPSQRKDKKKNVKKRWKINRGKKKNGSFINASPLKANLVYDFLERRQS